MPGSFPLRIERATVTRAGRNIPVVAYLPIRGAGERSPLVLFFPGFQLESQRYVTTVEYVANHGVAVVRADPPASILSVDHNAMAADARAVLDWALATTGPVAASVDAARVGAMGHSLGGKVATMLAFADPRVRALLGIDPVNGGSPLFGYTAALPNIVPSQVTPLTIPVGFMGETTNGSGGIGGQPCAPTAQNFQTFYAAATNAPWAAQWTVTGADHMDFVDDTTGCGFVCGACTQGTTDSSLVQEASHILAAAFFRRHLLGDTAMDRWLFGNGVPMVVTTVHRP